MPDKPLDDFDSPTLPPKTDPLRTYAPNEALSEGSSSIPQLFGRYRAVALLGRGGFGEVYRAVDDQLQRDVAIKVTFRRLIEESMQNGFLTEARVVASLDHPSIVPVYDVGQNERGDYYVVSKLIDGSDLATRIKLDRPDRILSLRIVEAIADALHHAHSRGLVHRDIKPANILLDRSDRPFLTDFGIALRESSNGKGTESAGTPAYMSPEQARGEGHRVDNRSDIYSLGIVLYELMTGRRPFRSENLLDLLTLIASEDVRSPRLFDDTISVDLERICMKALARRATDRYTIAKDFADEVRWMLSVNAPTPGLKPSGIYENPGFTPQSPLTPNSAQIAARVTDSQRTGPTKVVPKGLRSFDASDSSFFLELLPGPFDRDGLPEGLRFWKTRIEESDPDKSFRIGLVYGPSGCGKSSLMKAGLIPRLNPSVIPIYIESTPDDTEQRLMRAIRKAIPDAEGESLKETLSVIRRRKLVPRGGKLLLVLDQFEQWLHAEHDYSRASLTEALRQCDGGLIQAIVMVRDDFWLSVSRFLKELEVRIVEAENSSLVDLFDLDHAAKVLGLFGKSYGKLPDSSSQWSNEQHEFLRQAVAGLSQDRKVISVRLAIFSDMMKSREWTTAALREVGGIEGVGVTFLEETFSAKHASIQNRQHQAAVRGLLSALLPAVGTDIKGSSCGVDTLRAASGYERKPSEFAELMEILDRNLRLITPVESTEPQVPAATTPDTAQNSNTPAVTRLAPAAQEYQLTHDYLVPSLRDWLTRKQRETRKGRAELKLAERAAAWNEKRESKQLPTLNEWLGISRLTERKHWTGPQRLMMRRAKRMQVARLGVAFTMFVTLAGIVFAGKRYFDNQIAQKQASGLVDNLVRVESAKLAVLLDKLNLPATRKYAEVDLLSLYNKSEPKSVDRLHAALGLLKISDREADEELVQFVSDRLLDSSPESFLAIRSQLATYKNDVVVAEYWRIVSDESKEAGRRFRAGAALAMWDPDNPAWADPQVADMLSNHLVDLSPVHLATWQQALQPVAKRLLPSLQSLFANAKTSETQKSLAVSLIEDYAKDDPQALVATMIEADPKSFATLLPVLKHHGSGAITELEKVLDRKLEPQWNDAPLDPKWTVPDASVRTAIELAYGIIEERFAFVQDMPLAKFLEVAETLRASGYRPTRIRPWSKTEPQTLATTMVPASSEGETSLPVAIATGLLIRRSDCPAGDTVHTRPLAEPGDECNSRLISTVTAQLGVTRLAPAAHISAVWTRDNKRWLIETDVAKSSLPTIDQVAKKDGMLLEDVSPLPLASDNDEPTFIALWSEPKSSDREHWCLVDSSESTLRSTEAKNREGKSAHTITIRTDKNGERHYSVIWSSLGTTSEMYWREEGFDLPYQPQFDIACAPPRKVPNPLDWCKTVLNQFEALPDEKKSDPSTHDASLAIAYYNTGKIEQALLEIDQLITQSKNVDSWQNYRILALARLGRSEEAREALTKFVDVYEDEAQKCNLAIQVEAWLGNWDKANELIATAETKYKGEMNGLYWLARASAQCSAASIQADTNQSAIYSTKTIELLEQLLATGYSKGYELETDAEFEPLHGDARFFEIRSRISPSQPYAAIRKPDITVESKLVHNEGWIDMSALREHFNSGYRPIAIAIQPEPLAFGSNTTESKTINNAAIARSSVVLQRPLTPDSFKETLALKQARAAIALIQLNSTNRVWPLLKHQPDPRVRSYLLYYLTQFNVDPASMIERLKAETEVSSRRILILAIGDYAKLDLLSKSQKTELSSVLLRRFSEEPDTGVHSACEWSLKQLGAQEALDKLRAQYATGEVVGSREWYVTKQGTHTMLVIHPKTDFLVGSPITEAERTDGPKGEGEHQRRLVIRRNFAIATCEVTSAQFSDFRPNWDSGHVYFRRSDLPPSSISWELAASYCNWLSEREGIPREEWCYNSKSHDDYQISPYPDHLLRTGYRLPTPGEWEYACRASTTTARYFGESETLLARYAWYAENSKGKNASPVGIFIPNDLGLFDSYGNVNEWCQNLGRYSYRESVNIDDGYNYAAGPMHPVKGGSFLNPASDARSSSGISSGGGSYDTKGFRLARTHRLRHHTN